MTEFVQFLVLGFTALVWWLAKRDLTARASRLRAASSAEVDELKETVEALTAALEARVTTEEKRLSTLIAEARALQSPLISASSVPVAPGKIVPTEEPSVVSPIVEAALASETMPVETSPAG